MSSTFLFMRICVCLRRCLPRRTGGCLPDTHTLSRGSTIKLESTHFCQYYWHPVLESCIEIHTIGIQSAFKIIASYTRLILGEIFCSKPKLGSQRFQAQASRRFPNGRAPAWSCLLPAVVQHHWLTASIVGKYRQPTPVSHSASDISLASSKSREQSAVYQLLRQHIASPRVPCIFAHLPFWTQIDE